MTVPPSLACCARILRAVLPSLHRSAVGTACAILPGALASVVPRPAFGLLTDPPRVWLLHGCSHAHQLVPDRARLWYRASARVVEPCAGLIEAGP